MSLENLKSKLVGNDENRAVSPVIGVILMVAITVILAATIAAFVMDMGQSQEEPVSAAVDVEVQNSNNQTAITITDAGNAESFEIRGAAVKNGPRDVGVSSTGQSVTLDKSYFTKDGEVSVVGIKGDSETVVTTFDVSFESYS